MEVVTKLVFKRLRPEAVPMKAIALFVVLAVSYRFAAAQEPLSPQAHFDAGRYQEAIDTIATQQGEPPPELIFLLGRSHLRLNQPDPARMQFAKLSAGIDPPTPWSLVGESSIALVDGNATLAVEKANQAVALAPDQFHPNYQLGLAASAAEQWETAATALEKATTLAPESAYAHYFAGMAYSRLRQLDRMATHLEYFLKLAPDAPERLAVTSLMRSVRGL
jgi:tetratricopeptide (TPR) repeat protein